VAGLDLSSELIRMVFQDLEEGLIRCDLEGHIMDINRGAEAILGLDNATLDGENFAEAGILRREDLKPVAAGLKILNAPAVIRRSGSRERKILISAFPITGDSGEVEGMLLALKPVLPETGSAGESWRKWGTTFLEQITRNLNEGAGFTDLEGRFLFANRALSEIVGLEAEELRGRFLPSCVKPVGRPLLFLEVLESTIRQERWGGELEIEVGGEKKTIQVNTSLVKEEEGDELGISLVVRDISALKRLEEETEEYRHELSIVHGMLKYTSDYYDLAGTVSDTLNHILHALHSEAGALLVWDREEGRLRLQAATGFTYRGIVRLEEEAHKGRHLFRAFKDNQPWLVEDATTLRSKLEVDGKRGRLLSLLAAPVQSGAVTLGVVVVGHKQAGAFTLQHAETLTSMASRMGVVFELARTVNSLQEKVEELGIEKELGRSLLECMPNMVFLLDGEGKLTSANRSALEMLGQNEEDWKGKPFTRLICTRDRGAWRRLAGEAEEGETFRLEAHMFDGDNNEMAVELSGRLTGSRTTGRNGLLVIATPAGR
jgi:PAS domain S-box-containing protein